MEESLKQSIGSKNFSDNLQKEDLCNEDLTELCEHLFSLYSGEKDKKERLCGELNATKKYVERLENVVVLMKKENNNVNKSGTNIRNNIKSLKDRTHFYEKNAEKELNDRMKRLGLQ
jgi:hypothetical protein